MAFLLLNVSCDDKKTEEIPVINDADTIVSEFTPEQAGVVSQTFAFSLLKSMYNDSITEDIIFSPASTQMHLAMLANGADGITKSNIEKVTGLSVKELNVYNRQVIDHVKEYGPQATIEFINRIWMDNSLEPDSAFQNAIESHYDGEILKTDFSIQPHLAINSWINTRTNGFIPELVGSMPANTKVYAASTLYLDLTSLIFHTLSLIKFEGLPQGEFRGSRTFLADSAYFENDKVEMVRKSCVDKDSPLFLYLLVPKEGVTLGEVISDLSPKFWNDLISSKQMRDSILVGFPELYCNKNYDMQTPLQNMGLISTDSTYQDGKNGFLHIANAETPVILNQRMFFLLQKNIIRTRFGMENDFAAGEIPLEPIPDISITKPFAFFLIDESFKTIIMAGTIKKTEEYMPGLFDDKRLN